jgi:hypothetical protein
MIIFAIDCGITGGHSCSATCSRSVGWVPFHFGTKTRSINGATEEYLQTAGAKTGSGDAFITLIAGAVGIVLYLAIAAAVLWGLVAAVKWMWQHS